MRNEYPVETTVDPLSLEAALFGAPATPSASLDAADESAASPVLPILAEDVSSDPNEDAIPAQDASGPAAEPVADVAVDCAADAATVQFVEIAAVPGAADAVAPPADDGVELWPSGLPQPMAPAQAFSPPAGVSPPPEQASGIAEIVAAAGPAADDGSFPLADLADVNAGGGTGGGGAKPVATIAQLADYLINGFWQYNSTIAHHWASTTVTYNINGLTAAEQFLAKSAFTAWHEVTNLTFVQTTGAANITFNHNGSLTAFETDNYNNSGIMSSATVDISADWITTDGGAQDGKTGIDSYGYQTYIHEIGHALGLGHQGPYNGSASYSSGALYADDTWQYSVMSYFAENNYSGSSYRYVVTPQMADIYAVDSIYGAAATRTGDTVYGFHNTAGSIYDFAAYSSAPAYTIYDSGGRDTLDCSGYSAAQTIDLHPGSFSSVGGLVHNIGISTNTLIEVAIGGSGNDTLIANDSGCTLQGGGGNDTLIGGAGNDSFLITSGSDTVDGGLGVDTVVMSGLRSQFSISTQGDGHESIVGSSATATLLNVETLVFNDWTDHAPVATASNVTLRTAVAASSLFSAADSDGDSIAQYDFWDAGTGGGHFVINGVAQTGGHDIVVAASQLSQVSYVPGSVADTLWVRASDGTLWSNWSAAFTATPAVDAAPIVTDVSSNVSLSRGQTSVAAASLFTVSDPDGDSIAQYDFWAAGTNSGHFVVNGVAQTGAHDIIVAASQLSQVSYVAGGAADTLWVRASDGMLWSDWSASFTVTPAVDAAPIVTDVSSNVSLSRGQTSVAASSLFTVSDPDGDSMAQYDFWAAGTNSGHFVVNGVAQTGAHDIIVAASQLSQVSYVAGSAADTLWVRASDGTLWSNWSTAFTVTPAVDAAPIVTDVSSNISLSRGQTSVAASSLFTVSDPDGDSIAQYDFWNSGTGGGHFVVNGVAQTGGHDIIVAASQLSQVSYVAGSAADTLWVRASDGMLWSNWSAAFTATPAVDAAPIVTDVSSNVSLSRGQTSVAASSLFTVSDPDGDSIAQYDFWNSGTGGGHFVVNGVAQTGGHDIIVAASQLSQVSYVAGSAADTLWVRASDGMLWSNWSAAFTATPAVDAAPIVTDVSSNISLSRGVAASSLFTVSDPDGDSIAQYDFWDTGTGGGHFVVNGVAQTGGHDIIVAASQLSQVSYVPGSAADTLWVRASDGTLWSNWSTAFTVTPAVDAAPIVTDVSSNVSLSRGQTSVAAASLFTVSDPDGDSIAQYDFWAAGTNSGHFVVNGVAQTGAHDIIVAASQLSQVSYVAGSAADTMWVRASDGMLWSNWSAAFTVTPAVDAAPIVTDVSSNVSLSRGQTSVAAASLFTVSDPDGDSIAQYDFWAAGTNSGHFVVNGVAQTGAHDIIVAASQLSQVSYVAGSAADTLWVRASDGVLWSDWSAPVTVTPATSQRVISESPDANVANSNSFEFQKHIHHGDSEIKGAQDSYSAYHSSTGTLVDHDVIIEALQHAHELPHQMGDVHPHAHDFHIV